MEGQKHKKKEAAAKQMEAGDGYKCSLCDVVCTGTEAFNAHLKGAKHLKVGCGVVFFVFQKVGK